MGPTRYRGVGKRACSANFLEEFFSATGLTAFVLSRKLRGHEKEPGLLETRALGLTRLNITERTVKEYKETFTWAYVSYILASVERRFSGK